ncbi:MAG: DRTGG domain-containing protein [Spirochaetaceae bacterium]
MTIAEIIEAVDGRIAVGDRREHEVFYGFSSDLMSDVLTIMQDNVLLITGLSNTQTVRTATMADITTVLLVRDKRATDDMKQAAEENDLVLLETAYSMFRASGILYGAGLKAVF